MIWDTFDNQIRRLICRCFGIGSWHYEGFNDKEYARITVCKVNGIISRDNSICDGTVIEIGCGLGDVIGNIKGEGIKKEGYDIDKRMICAAGIMNLLKRGNVKYICGSFRNIKGKKIDCLIIVNWLHNVPQKILKKEFAYLIRYNLIKWIVVDEVRNDTSKYMYEHDYDNIIGIHGYKRIYNGKRIKAAGKAYRNIIAYRKY